MMVTKSKKLDLHPDEVFQGIVDYVASTGYALRLTSNIDLIHFDNDLLASLNIEPPVYSYKGFTRHETEEKDNG